MELTSDDKNMLDTIPTDIQNKLFNNGKLRKEFEPYIFDGETTDKTLDKLYEGKSVKIINTIHRALLYSATYNLIQSVVAEIQGNILGAYAPYFKAEDIPQLEGVRPGNISKYLKMKINEAFPIPED
ncbi:MAG: hypothetical protein H6731_02330 [Myxococcales bacterium]|nr:MAG: hypothetical protein H6731_02330 [Myxococcales bacterium]